MTCFGCMVGKRTTSLWLGCQPRLLKVNIARAIPVTVFTKEANQYHFREYIRTVSQFSSKSQSGCTHSQMGSDHWDLAWSQKVAKPRHTTWRKGVNVGSIMASLLPDYFVNQWTPAQKQGKTQLMNVSIRRRSQPLLNAPKRIPRTCPKQGTNHLPSLYEVT